MHAKQSSTTLPLSLQSTPIAGTHATIIEVSPRDELIFAYFPTRPGDMDYGINAGVGLIYERKKGDAINEWHIASTPLVVPGGDGIVAAKWLMKEREVSFYLSSF